MQLGFQFLNLPRFKCADDQPPPGLTGAGQGGEHPFEDGPLAEGVRNDFGSAAFLAEQAQAQCPVGVIEPKAVDGLRRTDPSFLRMASASGLCFKVAW